MWKVSAPLPRFSQRNPAACARARAPSSDPHPLTRRSTSMPEMLRPSREARAWTVRVPMVALLSCGTVSRSQRKKSEKKSAVDGFDSCPLQPALPAGVPPGERMADAGGSRSRLRCSNCGSRDFESQPFGGMVCAVCGHQPDILTQESEFDGRLYSRGKAHQGPSRTKVEEEAVDPSREGLHPFGERPRACLEAATSTLRTQARALVRMTGCPRAVYAAAGRIWVGYIEGWLRGGAGDEDSKKWGRDERCSPIAFHTLQRPPRIVWCDVSDARGARRARHLYAIDTLCVLHAACRSVGAGILLADIHRLASAEMLPVATVTRYFSKGLVSRVQETDLLFYLISAQPPTLTELRTRTREISSRLPSFAAPAPLASTLIIKRWVRGLSLPVTFADRVRSLREALFIRQAYPPARRDTHEWLAALLLLALSTRFRIVRSRFVRSDDEDTRRGPQNLKAPVGSLDAWFARLHGEDCAGEADLESAFWGKESSGTFRATIPAMDRDVDASPHAVRAAFGMYLRGVGSGPAAEPRFDSVIAASLAEAAVLGPAESKRYIRWLRTRGSALPVGLYKDASELLSTHRSWIVAAAARGDRANPNNPAGPTAHREETQGNEVLRDGSGRQGALLCLSVGKNSKDVDWDYKRALRMCASLAGAGEWRVHSLAQSISRELIKGNGQKSEGGNPKPMLITCARGRRPLTSVPTSVLPLPIYTDRQIPRKKRRALSQPRDHLVQPATARPRLSSWNRFVAYKTAEIRRIEGSMNPNDAMMSAAAAWRALTQSERSAWDEWGVDERGVDPKIKGQRSSKPPD